MICFNSNVDDLDAFKQTAYSEGKHAKPYKMMKPVCVLFSTEKEGSYQF